jgi:hypothetical protein
MNSRLASILAGAALLCTTGPAAAATTIGQIDPGTGPQEPCSDCNYLQIISAPGTPSYVAPTDGVITAWSFRAAGAAGGAQLQLYAPGPGPGKYTLAAVSAIRTFAKGEVATSLTQIPVEAGMHLGVGVSGPEPYFDGGNAADVMGAFDVKVPLGTSGVVGAAAGPARVNMAAALEPDADNDGYGDETQDACPSDPTLQTKCSPPPPPSPGPKQPSTPDGPPAQPAGPAITITRAGALVSLVTPTRESIRSGFVTVSATSVGRVTLGATGTIAGHKLGSANQALGAGGRTTLKLKISKKTLRAIRKRLAHHKRVSARVTVTAGGNTTSVRVRLVR